MNEDFKTSRKSNLMTVEEKKKRVEKIRVRVLAHSIREIISVHVERMTRRPRLNDNHILRAYF